MTRLAALTWPEVARRAGTSILAVPLGATEQHGPHLPLRTDTAVAQALADNLAARRNDVLVAPPVPYGSSGEHADFPGTLSIGRAATELLITELVRSADAFHGTVLICGHGGNLDPLRRAVRTLRDEGRRVLAWLPTGPGDDSHAGATETAAMLKLHPDEVRPYDRITGNTTPLAALLPTLRSQGVRAVTENGVLGDPSRATEDAGVRILEEWTLALVRAVAAWA
jgi:mycofactocin precursor peptide peptidase